MMYSEDKYPDLSEMLMNTEAALFDMDGTLIDSLYIWHDIDIEFLGSYGFEVPDDYDGALMGMSFTQVAEYTKARFGLPESIEEICAIWNRMAEYKYEYEVGLKPGAGEFAAMCYDKGIRLAICTSNSRHLVEKCLRRLGLDRYFSCILTGDEIKNGKPAPDIYLAAAKRLRVPPERCLVFEDVVPGILAGKNAGMRVCAVWDENTAKADTQKRELADYYIRDYRSLKEK